MRVAVIGAGPAGMTAAYQLTKGGAEVEVFEAADAVGGLAGPVGIGRVDELGERPVGDDLGQPGPEPVPVMQKAIFE